VKFSTYIPPGPSRSEMLAAIHPDCQSHSHISSCTENK